MCMNHVAFKLKICDFLDPSPEPWDEWREKVDAKLKEVREMMKSHERSCDALNVRIFVIWHLL